MLKKLVKRLLLNFYPHLYKKILFRKLNQFSWNNLNQFHLDPELLLLPFLLNDREKVFFDIGANKGEYTFVAHKLIHASNVFCFEPNPELNYKLTKMFKNSMVHKLAFSNFNGKAKFKIPQINNASDDSLGTLELGYVEPGEMKRMVFEVDTITLDDFVEKRGLKRLDLIKIDVEGHEAAVISGAERTLLKYKPAVLIEIEQRHHPDKTFSQLFTPLLNIGYNISYFNFKLKKMIDCQKTEEIIQDINYFGTRNYINNFICIHNKSEHLGFMQKVNAAALLIKTND